MILSGVRWLGLRLDMFCLLLLTLLLFGQLIMQTEPGELPLFAVTHLLDVNKN